VGGPTGSFLLWDLGVWSMHFAPIIVQLGSEDSAILSLATRDIQIITHWRPDPLCLWLTCCHQTKEKKRPITQARVNPLPPFHCPLEACYDSVIKTSTPTEEGAGSITTSVNASVEKKFCTLLSLFPFHLSVKLIWGTRVNFQVYLYPPPSWVRSWVNPKPLYLVLW
jgi:hypothetical protein